MPSRKKAPPSSLRRGGRPRIGNRTGLTLTDNQRAIAERLGGGNMSDGVRKALEYYAHRKKWLDLLTAAEKLW